MRYSVAVVSLQTLATIQGRSPDPLIENKGSIGKAEGHSPEI